MSQLCTCHDGPRCQMDHCAEPARWSTLQAAVRHHRARATFMCGQHFEIYREAMTKQLPGIDPPPNASEFWRPALSDCIRLAAIKIAFDERPRTQPAPLHRRGDDRYTPEQLRQVMTLRRAHGQST